MTSSRVITGLPERINARTKPLRGHTKSLDRLRTELRAYREGDELSGPVAVLILIRDRRGDVDARIKAILDGGEGVLYADDKQVGPLAVIPAEDDGPPVEVQVYRWPAERRAWLAAQEAATSDGSENEYPIGCGGPA